MKKISLYLLILFLLSSLALAADPVFNDAVFIWELQTDGSIPDATGNGNPAQIIGSPVFQGGDGGYLMDGMTSCPDTTGQNTIISDFSAPLNAYFASETSVSFEIWAEWGNFAAHNGWELANLGNQTGGNTILGIQTNNANKLRAYRADVGVVEDIDFIAGGGAQHFLFTFNATSNNLTIYLNGTFLKEDTTTLPNDPTITGDLFFYLFQNSNGQCGETSAANITRVALFNGGKSAADAVTLWNGGTILRYVDEVANTSFRISQTPDDLTSTNLLNYEAVNITYFTNASVLNLSTGFLNYTIEHSQSDGWVFINGSVNASGVLNKTLQSNTTNTSFFQLDKREIYPYISNRHPDFFNQTISAHNLSATHIINFEFLNFSTGEAVNFLEVNYLTDNPVTASNVYACNSTYSTGNPNTNANCVLLESYLSLPEYNNTHEGSGHNIVPIPVNTSSGQVANTIGASDGKIYILIRGGNGNTNVSYVNTPTRTNSVKTSTNNGNAWTSQAWTIDAFLYQFDGGDNLTYNYCAFNLSASLYCEDVSYTDNLDLTLLPPTSAQLLEPLNATNSTSLINVSWTNATASTPGQSIDFYLVHAHNSTGGFVKVIANTTQTNLTNFNLYVAGLQEEETYYFEVHAYSSGFNSTSGFSGPVYLDFADNYLRASGRFDYTNGFATNVNTTLNYSCTNDLNTTAQLLAIFNGQVFYNGSATSGTFYTNSTLLTDGSNALNVTCSDYNTAVSNYSNQTAYVKQLILIDEVDNTLFDVSNLSSVRVYYDDNSTYYDFKSAGTNVINITINDTDSLRFEFKRDSGEIITTYVNLELLDTDARICANKDEVTEYQQAIISSTQRRVVLTNVFSNCLVAADYTRFAYQNSYILQAYTINSLYYLYIYVDDVKTYLASVDGSIQTFINLDVLEFSRGEVPAKVVGDSLSITTYSNFSAVIVYRNFLNDSTTATATITRLDTGDVVFTDTLGAADANRFTIFFDYSTLSNVTNSTLFMITITREDENGNEFTLKKYFNQNFSEGTQPSAWAYAISLAMVIFGLTMLTASASLGWFGFLVVCLAIAVLTMAPQTTATLILGACELVVAIFLFSLNLISTNKGRGGLI